LQAAGRALQDAFQALNRAYQAQQLAADKARAHRDAQALLAAGDAVGKLLSAWQAQFKGSRADIENFKKKNSADRDKVEEADKLLVALNAMVNAVMGIIDWKEETRGAKLAELDYKQWLRVLKLEESEYAKQLVVDFEYATRSSPVNSWARAFDKIIAAFEIPKARGSEWLTALLRARLVPTFE
jgi:hypothetical protein